jgi:hypothetical protein
MLRPGRADVVRAKAAVSAQNWLFLQIARTVLQTAAKGTKRELFIKAISPQLREPRVIALEALDGFFEFELHHVG